MWLREGYYDITRSGLINIKLCTHVAWGKGERAHPLFKHELLPNLFRGVSMPVDTVGFNGISVYLLIVNTYRRGATDEGMLIILSKL